MSEEMKCSHIDAYMGQCKWNHRDITYYEDMTFNGLTREEVKNIYDEAFARWGRVANINPIRINTIKGANVVARAGFLGVALGWSGLPCGANNENTQLSQTIRSNKKWTIEQLLEVLTHEIGHSIGLGHSVGTIMSPSAMGFKELTQKDISNIQELYGPRDNPIPIPKPKPIYRIKVGETKTYLVDNGDELKLQVVVPKKGLFGIGKTSVTIKSDNAKVLFNYGKYLRGGIYDLILIKDKEGFNNEITVSIS